MPILDNADVEHVVASRSRLSQDSSQCTSRRCVASAQFKGPPISTSTEHPSLSLSLSRYIHYFRANYMLTDA